MMQFSRFYTTRLESKHLSLVELASLMGYGKHPIPSEIQNHVDQLLMRIHSECRPKYGYAVFPGKILDREHIAIGDLTFRPGNIITSALKHSDHFAVFLATLGEEFDQCLSEIRKEGDILSDFITDALGSVLAEGVVTELTQHLSAEMDELDFRISNNYSPGYCDWKLEDQKKIFTLIPEELAGVTLTDSCLMTPIKSVSGIIGIGRNMEAQPYKCDICRNTQCIKNKHRNKAEEKI